MKTSYSGCPTCGSSSPGHNAANCEPIPLWDLVQRPERLDLVNFEPHTAGDVAALVAVFERDGLGEYLAYDDRGSYRVRRPLTEEV